MKTNKAAFTLLEIAVVLMVTVLVSSMAAVGFYQFVVIREKANVESALDQIATAQRAALQRNPALSRNNLAFNTINRGLPNGELPSALDGWNVNYVSDPPYATNNGRNYRARSF